MEATILRERNAEDRDFTGFGPQVDRPGRRQQAEMGGHIEDCEPARNQPCESRAKFSFEAVFVAEEFLTLDIRKADLQRAVFHLLFPNW